jgi:hypothetical protein
MKDQEASQTGLTADQVLTFATVVDGEQNLINTDAPDVDLGEKAEKPPISYRRSRDIALMKLSLLRGEDTGSA